MKKNKLWACLEKIRFGTPDMNKRQMTQRMPREDTWKLRRAKKIENNISNYIQDGEFRTTRYLGAINAQWKIFKIIITIVLVQKYRTRSIFFSNLVQSENTCF